MIPFNPLNDNNTVSTVPHSFLPEFGFCTSPQPFPTELCASGDPDHASTSTGWPKVYLIFLDNDWFQNGQVINSDQMRYKEKYGEMLLRKCLHWKAATRNCHLSSSFWHGILPCLDAMPTIAVTTMPSWSHCVVICTKNSLSVSVISIPLYKGKKWHPRGLITA